MSQCQWIIFQIEKIYTCANTFLVVCTATEYICNVWFIYAIKTYFGNMYVLLIEGDKPNRWIKELVVDKVDPPCPLIGKNSSDYLYFWIYLHRKKKLDLLMKIRKYQKQLNLISYLPKNQSKCLPYFAL